MPTTARGIQYPSSTDDVRVWEDIQALATTANDALDDLDADVPAILARGNRSTSKTGVTTETAFFRFDDVAITSGHGIGIEVTGVGLRPASNDATQVGAIRIRYTTDGSTPTTSSTELSLIRIACPTSSNSPYVSLSATYYPASNETLSVLFTVAREAGGVNQEATAANGSMQFKISDQGVAPASSGTSI